LTTADRLLLDYHKAASGLIAEIESLDRTSDIIKIVDVVTGMEGGLKVASSNRFFVEVNDLVVIVDDT